jgi:hypothetical protein
MPPRAAGRYTRDRPRVDPSHCRASATQTSSGAARRTRTATASWRTDRFLTDTPGRTLRMHDRLNLFLAIVATLRQVVLDGTVGSWPGFRRAAHLMDCSIGDVRDLIASGDLTAGFRRAPQGLPARGSGAGPGAPGEAGTAAETTGGRPRRSPAPRPPRSRVRELAAAGLIPAVRDANGHCWYRPDHLDLVVRAWRATEANDHI